MLTTPSEIDRNLYDAHGFYTTEALNSSSVSPLDQESTTSESVRRADDVFADERSALIATLDSSK